MNILVVFTLEDINALPATEQLLEEGKTCLEQLVVTPGMIEAKIKGLKDNKSPGAGGISPRLEPVSRSPFALLNLDDLTNQCICCMH